MKRMSTRTHGVLDLLTAGTLVALPRMLGWGERVTNTLTGVALGSLGYSLLTNYEFGLIRILPMRAHLAIDALSGAALCASPAMFPEEDRSTHAALVALGLFEIGAGMMTQPEPYSAESYQMARSLGRDHGRLGDDFAAGVRRSATSASL
jgi:hypothetical protein